MDYVFIWKNQILKHILNLKHIDLSNLMYICCKIKLNRYKLLPKIGLIKYLCFFCKVLIFKVKYFDMLKNEILKKQAKRH